MHQVIVLGRVSRDPEVKTSGAGKPYTRLSVVCNRKNNGEDVSTWFTVLSFGKTGEYVAMNAKKGIQVYVDGVLSPSAYINKDGEAKPVLNVLTNNIRIFTNNSERGAQESDAPDHISTIDEELPFL